MEFYISPQSGQFYMINVLENQWLSVTYKRLPTYAVNRRCCKNVFIDYRFTISENDKM